MKLLTIATILLILTAPAFAASNVFVASKKDMKDIHSWEDLHGTCVYGNPAKPDWKKKCAAADVLGKKMEARGYCMVGHGSVGRSGRPWTQKEWERTGGTGTVWPKGRKHCYFGFRSRQD